MKNTYMEKTHVTNSYLLLLVRHLLLLALALVTNSYLLLLVRKKTHMLENSIGSEAMLSRYFSLDAQCACKGATRNGALLAQQTQFDSILEPKGGLP